MKNISSKLNRKIRSIKISLYMDKKFITRKLKYFVLYTRAIFYFIFDKKKCVLLKNKIETQKLCDVIEDRLLYLS